MNETDTPRFDETKEVFVDEKKIPFLEKQGDGKLSDGQMEEDEKKIPFLEKQGDGKLSDGQMEEIETAIKVAQGSQTESKPINLQGAAVKEGDYSQLPPDNNRLIGMSILNKGYESRPRIQSSTETPLRLFASHYARERYQPTNEHGIKQFVQRLNSLSQEDKLDFFSKLPPAVLQEMNKQLTLRLLFSLVDQVKTPNDMNHAWSVLDLIKHEVAKTQETQGLKTDLTEIIKLVRNKITSWTQ